MDYHGLTFSVHGQSQVTGRPRKSHLLALSNLQVALLCPYPPWSVMDLLYTEKRYFKENTIVAFCKLSYSFHSFFHCSFLSVRVFLYLV